MSLPSESFNLENGHDIKTNSLFFLVHQTHGGGSKSNPKGDIIEKNNNTVISNKSEDKGNFEPFKKRQKMNKDPSSTKLFSVQLVVYDQNENCMLMDGEYELVLREVAPEATGDFS